MKKLTFALCILLSGAAHAQGTAAPAPYLGKADAGKTKSAPCAACHGADGNSVADAFPKIAGQHPGYIQAQLQAFKSGARNNPIMSPQAATLTPEDMADLAAYFSSQTTVVGRAKPDLVALGEKTFRGGNKATNLPACLACHGPAGAGNPAAKIPSLSGQHPAYIQAQLESYKTGGRVAQVGGSQMKDVASRMSAEEVQAVSAYIGGVHQYKP